VTLGRVHPLPEALIDYVWDYGALGNKEELMYIQAMVEDVPVSRRLRALIIALISMSQNYIHRKKVRHKDSIIDISNILE
jgi:hypothetical protein